MRLLIFAFLLACLVACREEEQYSPVPALTELTCSVMATDEDLDDPANDRYRATFQWRYLDGDQDLDAEGAILRWWIDDVEQTPQSLFGASLGLTGRISLNAEPLMPFELYVFRISVVDAAGNESNVLNADVDTDAITCSIPGAAARP